MKKIKYLSLFFVLLMFLTVFAYSRASIRVTAPNGGETLYLGESYTIRWIGSDLEGLVQIMLVKGKFTTRTIHTFRISRRGFITGSYSWAIPRGLTLGSDYKIKIVCTLAKGSVYDQSDGFFSLTSRTMYRELPMVRVLAPNGGERIMKTSSYRIRWRSNVEFRNANIHIIKGRDTLRIYNNITASGPYGDGEWGWNWAVPRDLPNGSDYKVKVEGYRGTATDLSNSTFTITDQSITVFYPRAGDTWYYTTNQMITFRCEGISQNVKIYAAGYPHYPIAENIRPSTERVMWTNVGTSRGVVFGGTDQIIVETMDGTVRGYSGRFSLREPTIDVTSPPGGSRVRLGSSVTIRWNAPHLGGNVDIILYRKSGSSWIRVSPNIASNTSNDGSHTGVLPLSVDTRYKIRVASVLVASIYGESGEFTILRSF